MTAVRSLQMNTMAQYLPQKPAALPLIAALAANSYFLYGNIGASTAGVIPYVRDRSSAYEVVRGTNWFIEKGKVLIPVLYFDLPPALRSLKLLLNRVASHRSAFSLLLFCLVLSSAAPHFSPQTLELDTSAPQVLSRRSRSSRIRP